MKKLLYILICLLIPLSVYAWMSVNIAGQTVASGCTPSVQEENGLTNQSSKIRLGKTGYVYGFQSFSHSADLSIYSVDVGLQEVGTAPAGDLALCFRTGSNGSPSAACVSGSTVSVDANDAAASWGWVNFEFSSPIAYTSGTTWHISLTGPYTDDSNCVEFGMDGSPVYPNGESWWGDTPDGTEQTRGYGDFLFRVNGCE